MGEEGKRVLFVKRQRTYWGTPVACSVIFMNAAPSAATDLSTAAPWVEIFAIEDTDMPKAAARALYWSRSATSEAYLPPLKPSHGRFFHRLEGSRRRSGFRLLR